MALKRQYRCAMMTAELYTSQRVCLLADCILGVAEEDLMVIAGAFLHAVV